jgi:hypothetical protein
MSWGKGITLSFITFAVFIGFLVAVCVRQEVNLVSADYYDRELRYQEEIDRMTNAAALSEKPVILVRNKKLEVHFDSFPAFENGELVITRPSDARFDAKFSVNTGQDSIRMFDVSKLPAGHYNTSLRWKMKGKEFLHKESVNL